MTRTMPPVDDQITVLMSGVDYGDALLRQQMERELRLLIEQDRPLRVYLGIDPTATSLTLGHTVPLRKLRQFQQFGHHAIFLIGDYTALIGDPSDKNKLRPMLTTEDIQRNEATYFEQAARILDAQRTELRHNSEWLGQLSFPDIISLMSKFTVQEMLRRDNFRQRFGRTTVDVFPSEKRVVWTTPAIGSVKDLGDGRYRAAAIDLSIVGFGANAWNSEPKLSVSEPVYLHEFLYALMQGYDAYALECDVQVGGTEQLFNLMAGRKIQEDAGQKPHVPVTLPILVGLDGKERMSKSKGNHIGVGDSPGEQYGKAMSIPDEAVEDFFTLATNLHPDQVRELMDETRSGRRSPIDTKKHLAWTIVSEFWGEAAAAEAQDHFERTIQRKEVPDEVPEHSVADGALLLDVVVEAGAAPSRREARRLFEQRAVTMDGNVVEPTTPARKGTIVQVGKRRWIRLV